MTPKQYNVLKTIDLMTKANVFGPTHQELADVLGYKNRQSVSGIINRLLKLGYVVRTMLDRRNISTTPKGRKILKNKEK